MKSKVSTTYASGRLALLEREMYKERIGSTNIDKSPELLRSKNFIVKVCKVDDYHDNELIITMVNHVKLRNQWLHGALYEELSGGRLPSGKSEEEIIEKIRKDVFLRQELAKYPRSTIIYPVN